METETRRDNKCEPCIAVYFVRMKGGVEGDVGFLLDEKLLDREGVGFGCIARRMAVLSPVLRTARMEFSACWHI